MKNMAPKSVSSFLAPVSCTGPRPSARTIPSEDRRQNYVLQGEQYVITTFLQPRIDKTCWLAVKRQNHGAGRVLSSSSCTDLQTTAEQTETKRGVQARRGEYATTRCHPG